MTNPEDSKDLKDFEKSKPAFEASIQYGVQTSKALILLNGAAAGGLLTYLGNNNGAHFGCLTLGAVILFAFGAVLGVFVSFAGFKNLQNWASVHSRGKTESPRADMWETMVYIAGFASVIVFMIAVILAGADQIRH